jgi:AcrR family transcriptional regulator
MGRTAEETRARILDSAYVYFYRHGFARASMDAIAAASGVTKRTIYLHYPSKDDLLAAVLVQQERVALRLVSSWLRREARTPVELLDGIFVGIDRWAASPRWLGLGYTRVIIELADLPGHPARRIASRHKRAVEQLVADRLAELGRTDAPDLARKVVVLIEGCACLVLVHGDRNYIAAAAAVARRLLA